MDTNQKYLNRMTSDIRLRGLSENTQRMYIRYTEIFLEHCEKPVDELRESDAREFLIYLMRKGAVTTGTINLYNAAIRFFFAIMLNRTINYLQLPRFKTHKILTEMYNYLSTYR